MADLKSMYSALRGDPFPDSLTIILGDERLVYEKRAWELEGEIRGLRYGENPDQPAALYALKKGGISCGGICWRGPGAGLVSELSEGQMIQAGKHPGKINLTDVDNGANILQYLAARPAAVILKHNNPSGAAWVDPADGGIARAVERAYWGDRIAAFGGALVVNRVLDLDAAELVSSSYFEVVAAPGFEDGAVDILRRRKNLRILELPGLGRLEELAEAAFLDIKSLADGGLIIQKSFVNRIRGAADFLPATARSRDGLEVAARRPDRQEMDDLLFAWAVEAGVGSNSVVFARDGATLVIGAGEQDRVGCVELAIHKAHTKYADTLAFREFGLSLYEMRQKAPDNDEITHELARIETAASEARGGLIGSRMVSDGFFPFRDGVDAAIGAGVSAIAQPGGSLRDAEAIMACNEAKPQVAMVFTGQRSFRH